MYKCNCKTLFWTDIQIFYMCIHIYWDIFFYRVTICKTRINGDSMDNGEREENLQYIYRIATMKQYIFNNNYTSYYRSCCALFVDVHHHSCSIIALCDCSRYHNTHRIDHSTNGHHHMYIMSLKAKIKTFICRYSNMSIFIWHANRM